MGLIDSIRRTGEQAKETASHVTALLQASEQVGETLKKNILDPMDDLQKVLDSFQGPALGFKQSFEVISKSLHDGTIDVNQAREAMMKLMAMLERFALADKRAGDPGKINQIIQSLERFLNEMSKKGKRP